MRRRLQSIGEWVSGGFALAVTAGLIFTLIDPSLVWFVVLGLFLAGAPALLHKERGDSRVGTLVVLVGSWWRPACPGRPVLPTGSRDAAAPQRLN